MNVANIIANTGVAMRAGQDFDRTDAKDKFDVDKQNYERRVMASGTKKLDAEDSLLPGKTEAERLKNAADLEEQNFQKSIRPVTNATRATQAKLTAAQTNTALEQQPVQAQTTAATNQTALTKATGESERAGAEQNLATEEINSKTAEMRERQTARMWRMVKTGDLDGAKDLLQNSKLLNTRGGTVTGVTRGKAEVTTKDGQKARENVLRIELEGRPSLMIPEHALDALDTKYGSSLMESGGDIVRVGSDGKVTPVYTKPKFGVNSETGAVYDERTGASGPAAGVNGNGNSRKAVKDLDDRVKQSTAVINKYFGVSEFTGLDPKNQPKYIDIVNRASAKIRNGQDPEPAAEEAIKEVERAAAVDEVGGGKGYKGPRPWAAQ